MQAKQATHKPSNHRLRHRVREIVDGGFIVPVSLAWDCTVSPSQIAQFSDCPGHCLRTKEGDKPTAHQIVSINVGDVFHSEIAKPANQRVADVSVLLTKLPKQERARAAVQAEAVIAVAARAEKRESGKVVRGTVTEPKPMKWFDPATGITLVAKPDKMEICKDGFGEYLAVNDRKSGKHRHRLNEALAFLMGYVAFNTNALDFKTTTRDFEGKADPCVKTRLEYLRDTHGKLMSTPYYQQNIIWSELTEQQKIWLAEINSIIAEMKAAWMARRFKLQSGPHCFGCKYSVDCAEGKKFIEARR